MDATSDAASAAADYTGHRTFQGGQKQLPPKRAEGTTFLSTAKTAKGTEGDTATATETGQASTAISALSAASPPAATDEEEG